MGHSRERTAQPGGAERDERARSAPERPERIGPTFEPRGAELAGLGNRSLLALMRAGRLQARRNVSQADDPREVEADHAAERVVAGDRPDRPRATPDAAVVQRAPTEDEALANALGLGPAGSPGRAEPTESPQPPPPPEDADAGARGLFEGLHGGSGLDERTRSLMESRFGESFSHVRVHTGPRAEEAAESVRAHAFTVGQDIVFGEGQFAPDTSAGQRLLAHELTHVVQQRNATGPRAPAPTTEAEADGAAHDVETDRPLKVETRAEPGSVQRQPKEEQWGFSRPTSSVQGTTVEVNARPMAYMNDAELMQKDGSTWDDAKRVYGVSVSVLGRLRPWIKYSTAEADARRDNLTVVITGRSRFDNKTLTITIGSRAPPKKPPEAPPPPGPEEPEQEQPADTRPGSHARVQKVEQQSKDDPKGAMKEARGLSKEELGSLGAGPRKSLLNAAADSSTATTAPNLPRDLINTTPDRDAGALSDELKADGGKLLKQLKANESDSEAAADLESAAWDLDARRLDTPSPEAKRDIPDFTPEMKKKADEIRGLLTKIGRRTPSLDENMEGRPEWSSLKDKMDQDFQRQLRNLERSVKSWNAEHTLPGGVPLDSASEIGTAAHAELEKALEAMRSAKTERELFEGWKQARQALRRGTDAMDAKEKLAQLQSAVHSWNETQSGWASIASAPSHLFAGVSSDRPDQIAAQAKADIEYGLTLLRDAKTPEEEARASAYLKQALTNANHDLYLHKEAVYGGAEDVIVGIKVTAVVATVVVAAPVAGAYGAGAVTLKVVGTGIVVGAVGGGTLSAARQGVQIMEGSRKEFSFGEVGMGVVTGGAAGGLVVLAPEAVPVFMGLGVASSAEEFSQGHYATGTFDLGTALLPIAIKGGPGFARWARPRIAAGMMRVGTGVAEVPALGGNTYTPNIPGVAMMAEAGTRPMGGIPGGDFAVPEIGAIPEVPSTGIAAPKPVVNANPSVWQTVSPFGTALPGYQIPYVVQLGGPSTAATPGTPATPATPSRMPIILGAAKTQMKAEGDYKNLVGAAGEGAYMGSLSSRGAPNVNMNEFAGSAMNTPHLDVSSTEGLAQVKVRGSSGQPSKSALRAYKKDFLKLVDPEADPEGIAAGRRKAEAVANILANNRTALQSKGAWPQGLKPNATVPEILQYMREESVLAIPSDHVPAVRQAIAAEARANPETYGLKPGPNLEADIQKLTARIQSVGLTRKSLGTLETDYRSGVDTQSVDEE